MQEVRLDRIEWVDLRAMWSGTGDMVVRHTVSPSQIELSTDNAGAVKFPLIPGAWYTAAAGLWARGHAGVVLMTVAELQAILNPPAPKIGNGLPEGYEFRIGPNTKLQLWQGTVMLSEQDVDGTWLSTSVTTGVGSFHLGEVHSIGSAGQNVVFKNKPTGVSFFPVWQGQSSDGVSIVAPASRLFTAQTTGEPNGTLLPASTPMDYSVITAPGVHVSFTKVSVMPADTSATGGVWVAEYLASGIEISRQPIPAWVAGVTLDVAFEYPLDMRSGEQVRSYIANKSTGALMKCRGGSTAPTVPWRRTVSRVFTDDAVVTASNVVAQVRAFIPVYRVPKVTTFTNGNGTFVPDAAALYTVVELVSGGGSSSIGGSLADTIIVATGGNGGGYSMHLLTKAEVASVTSAGSVQVRAAIGQPANTGLRGDTSYFGAAGIVLLGGGAGVYTSYSSAVSIIYAAGLTMSGLQSELGTRILHVVGEQAPNAYGTRASGGFLNGGHGGSSMHGSGGKCGVAVNGNGTGTISGAASGYGGGGSGACNQGIPGPASSLLPSGSTGGFCIVTEYFQ